MMSLKDNTNKKKICICISCFNNYQTRFRNIIDFFNNKGYQTYYVTSDFNHLKKEYFKTDIPDTYQIHVPRYNRNISLARIYSQFIFSRDAYNFLKTKEPDIILCQFPPNSLVYYLIRYKKRNNCKIVFDGYDMWPESLPVKGIFRVVLYPFLWLWKNLRDWNIESCDLVTVVSAYFMDKAKSMWPKVPIKLLLPSISISTIPSYTYDVEKELSFCYLGNINHITDIDLLIEILSLVAKTKKVCLHIIGEGDNLEELLLKARKAGIECIPHGIVLDEKLKIDIYSQCHFALNLPKEEINSTMSLKSIEYLSVGLPFLNTGGGDSWDIVKKYKVGINVDRNNISLSANELNKLSKNDLKDMSLNCIEYAKNCKESQSLNIILKEMLN